MEGQELLAEVSPERGQIVAELAYLKTLRLALEQERHKHDARKKFEHVCELMAALRERLSASA